MKQVEPIPEDRRKDIFAALVAAQDNDMDVTQSRRIVAHRFGINGYQVELIEREGLDGEWPPL